MQRIITRQRWLFVAFLILFASPVAAELTRGDLILVSSKRVSRVAFEYTYRVEVTNTGPAVQDLAATVTSTSPGTVIVEGGLSFGEVSTDTTVTSADTFTLRQDRRFPFDPDALDFAVTFEPSLVVPTFESLGLYWSPIDAASGNICTVRYSEEGTSTWNEGFPLYFDESIGEYRGSLVHLKPETNYLVELTLSQTLTTAILTAKTWSEDFPIARTVHLPENSNTTLDITESGTPGGYLLYTHEPGKTATIDVAGQRSRNMRIDASHVVIRGLTFKGAERNAIQLLARAHDVVIEENDISGWGRIAENGSGFGRGSDGAIHSDSPEITRIIIQRNSIHHPRPDANSWAEERADTVPTSSGWHPAGPQAITFNNSAGNHVIRYNRVYSDEDHYFNDIFGGSSNCSFRGFPNRDSDIYGNQISQSWDDGIESEGANRNVRIWQNYISNVFQAIATRSTSVGPMYIWRNVSGSSRRSPLVSWDDDQRGLLHKAGSSGSCSIEMSDRGVFEFHNTILQLPMPGLLLPVGASNGPRGRMFNTTTRNNIFQIADPSSLDMFSIKATVEASMTGNDFDYDLYNGQLENVPSDQETNGIEGIPIYTPAPHFDASTGQGIFTLDPSSPGYDAGEEIPNFSDNFVGDAPDMGAHEAGTPPMEFGIDANRR